MSATVSLSNTRFARAEDVTAKEYINDLLKLTAHVYTGTFPISFPISKTTLPPTLTSLTVTLPPTTYTLTTPSLAPSTITLSSIDHDLLTTHTLPLAVTVTTPASKTLTNALTGGSATVDTFTQRVIDALKTENVAQVRLLALPTPPHKLTPGTLQDKHTARQHVRRRRARARVSLALVDESPPTAALEHAHRPRPRPNPPSTLTPPRAGERDECRSHVPH